jgi:peptidoglycan/xylan/chitin deacetylase (PgdA/CDA1 family)
MLRSLAIRCVEGITRLRSGDPRLLVLIYHRVLPGPDPMYPYDPDRPTFRRQMQALAEDFNVLGLGEAVGRLERRNLPARAVAVTFDDGFADNVTEALPVLNDIGLKATFFIASAYLEGGCMFNDCVIEACRQVPAGDWATGTAEFGTVKVGEPASRPRLAYEMIARLKYVAAARRMECTMRLLETAHAIPPPGIMMTHEQLRKLHAAGMEIGGHTRSHPILAGLPEADALQEIAGGKADLEALIGERVDLFAYPNGQPGRDYGPRDVGLARRLGFRAAVSTAWGYADRHSDRHQIARVGSWGGSAWRFSGRLALARGASRGESCASSAAGMEG